MSDRTRPCPTRTRTVSQVKIHNTARLWVCLQPSSAVYGTAVPVHGTGGSPMRHLLTRLKSDTKTGMYVVSFYLRVHRFRILFFSSTRCLDFFFISVQEQRVGNTSGCLVIFSKQNNLKVSVKKISCIALLLTHWQGRIDRTFIYLLL